MKNKKKLFGKTMGLIAALVLCFGMTVLAAPSVTGDTELTVQKDKIVSASYKITNDDSIESVKLTFTYDKSDLTYMSGSGGDNFSGSGGNGLVELSSNPGSKAATFGVKFKGLTDGTSEVTVSSWYHHGKWKRDRCLKRCISGGRRGRKSRCLCRR